jgi:hypothetical protein
VVLVHVAILVHLTTMLTVVLHLDELMARHQFWQLPLALLDRYSMVTFANRNFGFFAPSVTPDWNLRLVTTDSTGGKIVCRLPLPSREMEVKMYSMLGHFGESNDTMDLFARSWAVYVVNHHPGVVRVDVEVTRNYIPSMDEYRHGRRIAPQPFYSTTFEVR